MTARCAAPSRADHLDALILALLVLPSRIPVFSHYLTTWDSVQYALAVEQFNVALHQPHPPGYILLVGLLRAANFVLGDARLAILAVNTLFGMLAVGLTYLLGLSLFGRLAGLVAALLLLTSPTMWYCGATCEPYVVLAGLACLVAYLAGRAALLGERPMMTAATLALGLGGGLRPDAALFLAPLWLLSLAWLLGRGLEGRLRFAAGQVLLLAAASLVWYLPLLYLTGGYRAYTALSEAQLGLCFASKSVLFGAPWREQAVMAARHLLSAMLAVGPAAFGLLLAGLPWLAADRRTRPGARPFLLAWVLPAAGFYTIFFFSKPGYVLIYAPALALLAGRAFDLLSAALRERSGPRLASAGSMLALAGMLAVNTLIFLAGPCPSPGAGAAPGSGPGRLLRLARAEAASVSRAAIEHDDARIGAYLAALRQFSPQHAAIICRAGSPDWRQLMYYLRDRDVYWLVDSRLMHRSPNRSEFWLAHGGRVRLSSTGTGFWLPAAASPERLPVPLAPGIEELLIIARPGDPMLPGLASRLTCLRLGDGEEILRLRLKGSDVAADRFLFVRAAAPPPAQQASRLTCRRRGP